MEKIKQSNTTSQPMSEKVKTEIKTSIYDEKASNKYLNELFGVKQFLGVENKNVDPHYDFIRKELDISSEEDKMLALFEVYELMAKWYHSYEIRKWNRTSYQVKMTKHCIYANVEYMKKQYGSDPRLSGLHILYLLHSNSTEEDGDNGDSKSE